MDERYHSGDGTGETWRASLLLEVQEQSKPCQKAHQEVGCSAGHTATWKRLRHLEINMGENRIQSHSPQNTRKGGHVPEEISTLLSRNFSHMKSLLHEYHRS